MSSKVMSEYCSSPDRISKFLHKLDQDRIQQIQCDFEIRCREKSLHCHRMVLRNRSRLFQTEAETDVYECRRCYSVDMLEAVLRFLYTFHVAIDCDNVSGLLSISEEFELDDLQQLCEQYLDSIELTTLSWPLLAHCLCEFPFLNQIRRKIVDFFCDNFIQLSTNTTTTTTVVAVAATATTPTVTTTTTTTTGSVVAAMAPLTVMTTTSTFDSMFFLELDLLTLQCLLDRDDLPVRDERQVLDMARQWIGAREERSLVAGDILRAVRLPMVNLSHCDYQELCKDPAFFSEEAKHLLDQAIEYRVSPAYRWSLESPMTRPRPSTGLKETLIGIYPGDDADVFVYDEAEDKWTHQCGTVFDEQHQKKQFLLEGKYVASIVYYDGKFYLVDSEGGMAFCCANILRGVWNKLPNGFSLRDGARCVVAPNYIYLVGGRDHNADDVTTPSAVVERFDIQREKWEKVADLLVPVRYPCVFFANKKIYVIGGNGKVNDTWQKTRHIQVFDCERLAWTLLEDILPEAGVCMGAACYEGTVYIISNTGKLYALDLGTLECSVFVDFNSNYEAARMCVFQKKLVICQQNKAIRSVDIATARVDNMAFFPLDKWVYMFTIHSAVDSQLPLPARSRNTSEAASPTGEEPS